MPCSAHATQTRIYAASLEQSTWRTQSTPLACDLSQVIPEFGTGLFQQRAGEPLEFQLKPLLPMLQPGQAILFAQSPAWKPRGDAFALGEVEVTDHWIPIQVSPPFAAAMLEQLAQGLMPALSAQGRSTTESEKRIQVVMSAANFQDAYEGYQRCLAQLLPVSYEQIARSAIFFETSASTLADEVKQQLDLVVRYIKADPQVSRVVIDGHTDNVGDKRANVRLSQVRANLVAAYLKKAGVNAKMITVRYHGDRYPALANDTSDNRARNRRVTIRLDRS